MHALLLLPTLLSPLAAEDWPQWRGPHNGVAPAAKPPVKWSATENIAWKTPIEGAGHSSPVIAGDRIFLTTAIEGAVIEGHGPVKHTRKNEPYLHPDSVAGNRSHELRVLALDARTGKILWQKTAYEGKMYDDRHRKNTYASSTPVTDGKHLFVHFGSEGIYCFDFDGRLVWKASLGPMPNWGLGPGTSPVLFEDTVIIQGDNDGGETSFLAALSKRDGKLVWKTKRNNWTTWATPLLVQHAGAWQLITSAREATVSYDPKTGKELWAGPGVEGNACPSPVAAKGLVIVSSGYPVKRVLALRLDPAASERVAWQHDKGTAYVPSPVIYGDHLYLMTDKGILSCLDVATGKVLYDSGRPPVAAQFEASLLVVDGKILQTSVDGDTFVIQAGPEHKVLGTNPIGETVWSSLAVSGDALFLRGDKHLYRIEQRP
jgi:outer membrane protein assembly factor BamB